MTTFADLSPTLWVVLYVFDILVLIGAIFAFVQFIRYRRRLPLPLTVMVGSFALIQFMNSPEGGELPALLPAGLLLLLALATLLLHLHIRRWRRRHITRRSIKESMDALPMGICCYWPGGVVKLANRRMVGLSFELTGEALLDGESFWSALTQGKCREGVAVLRTGESPAVRLPGGAVFSFRRHAIEIDAMPLWEVLAVDETEQYALNAELAQKETQVREHNRHLRELGGEIERMTVEREVLAAKIRIHDDLGRALIRAKQFYLEGKPEDRADFVRFWRDTLQMVRENGPERWHDDYEYVEQSAREFGVELRVEGQLPQEEPLKLVIASALVTCLSNAVRHAGASRVTAALTGEGDILRLEVRNDGAPPPGPVTEGGGLANLRARVQRSGGVMTIEWSPRFLLRIELPREGERDGL